MGPLRRLIAVAALAFAAAPAVAQTVTSAGPDSVSVTIYRAPDAPADRELDLDWLQGYALVTERRTVTIPAGRAVVRFEGVAGGILPESAIVTGLPEGVREKNLDADLLSPRNLYARTLGRPVTIRRTVGGGVVEERAIIRSGPDGAAILQTRDGFIAVNCGGPPEDLIYDGVPADLPARPTLSVETQSAAAHQVTLTLSYLAWNFDWQANYVATMLPDGRSADLFAWVTLANGDVTGFTDAEAMVVAGRLQREDRNPGRPYNGGAGLSFSCFPNFVAEDISKFADGGAFQRMSEAPPPPPPPAPAMEAIMVTGARMAQQEELGDLKLYRLPDRTDVSAMSQKQVGMLDRKSVRVAVLYATRIIDDQEGQQVTLTLRAQNREAEGLGLPLPSGRVAVFEPMGERRLLIGEGSISDKAINEEVEIALGPTTQVVMTHEVVASGEGWEDRVVTVSNANPFAIRFEARLAVSDGYRRSRLSARLGRKNGDDLWAVEVSGNATRTLRFRLSEAGK